VDFGLMWMIARWGFKVPMRGSFAMLFGLSLLFIVAEIGWGLTLSAIARTLQQAALMICVLAMLDISFSGYVMPVSRMPTALQALAQVFPLQHYLVVIRSVMLKGSTLAAVWQPALALAALSVGSIAVAVISLHSRIE
jgi:ABC-2 type transport system permease protein